MYNCFDKEHDVLRVDLRGVVHNELPRVSAAQYGILMASWVGFMSSDEFRNEGLVK